MIHLDPVADGDPLAWALERLRTRLPQMLERAGARRRRGAHRLRRARRGAAARDAGRLPRALRARRREGARGRRGGGRPAMKVGAKDTGAAKLRAPLGHPVVDADGHVIETAPVFMPFFEDYVRKHRRRRHGEALPRGRRHGLRRDGAAPVEQPLVGRAARELGDAALVVVAAGRRTRSTAPPRTCRSCCTSGSTTSASTSRCSTAAARSPPPRSRTTRCGRSRAARSTPSTPRSTRRTRTA